MLLERVVTLYTQGFSESKTGRDYLAARGLLDLGLLTRHRVGYANGRLAQVLPTAGPVRRRLRTIGILTEGDREQFEGCVVVPVCDEAGRIVTLYGRSTATGPGAEGKRHVYLPNRPKGLWNIAALKGSPHVIAVESILDALSLETAGVANVVAIQGTQGLSEKDLETLKSMGTQRVTLLMDADAAGRAAEERLKEKLANFAVDKITLPEGEDPNSFLIKNGAAALSALLAPTPTPISLRSTPTSTSPVNTTSSPSGSPTLVLGLRRYEVRGLEKTARALKATIRVERAGKLHVDTLDLYSARARRQLVLDLVRILEETPDTIESDVLKLLTACESHPDTGLRGGAAAGQPRGPGPRPRRCPRRTGPKEKRWAGTRSSLKRSWPTTSGAVWWENGRTSFCVTWR